MENEVLNSQSSKKIIMRVSNISIVVNVLLSAIKFVVGVIANSGAMISDAIHSVSDVFSTIIVMIGANAAAKDPDQEHPYGHDRMECIAAIVLAIVLFITGIGVGITGVKKFSAAITEIWLCPER